MRTIEAGEGESLGFVGFRVDGFRVEAFVRCKQREEGWNFPTPSGCLRQLMHRASSGLGALLLWARAECVLLAAPQLSGTSFQSQSSWVRGAGAGLRVEAEVSEACIQNPWLGTATGWM